MAFFCGNCNLIIEKKDSEIKCNSGCDQNFHKECAKEDGGKRKDLHGSARIACS